LAYIFPALLSLIPALHLYINSRIPIQYACSSWIVIAVLMGILVLVLNLFIRDARKAGVIAALFSIAFFYFEPFLQQLDIVSFNLGLTKLEYQLLNSTRLAATIFIIWTTLWVVTGRYIARSELITKKVSSFLSVVSLVLLVTPMINIAQIVSNSIRIEKFPSYTFNNSFFTNSEEDLSVNDRETDYHPDIFYLIFDAFAGEDILNAVYGMDISGFVSQLENKGFYVAYGSKANYSQTINSLPSSMNMSYLDGLSKSATDPHNWSPLADALQKNLVSSFLDERGYELITFSSGFWPTENVRTDKKHQPLINLNEYQEGLLLITPIAHIFPDILYDLHRNRITFTLNNLPVATLSGEPRFVFAHLYIPHPPFVFDDAGNHIHVSRLFTKYDADGYRLKGGSTTEYQKMYAAQLNYLLDQILILVDEIIAETHLPPIIIIQGDHGPGSMITQRCLEEDNLDERFSIMNAYYFPGQDYSNLYPGITPVNTFRVVFDQYFGADLGLLADRNYFSTVFEPYNYSEMTELLK